MPEQTKERPDQQSAKDDDRNRNPESFNASDQDALPSDPRTEKNEQDVKNSAPSRSWWVRFNNWRFLSLRRWRNRWPIVIAVATLTVIFGQARIYYQQSQIMERTLHVSQRAYVVVTEIKIDFATKQMLVALENIGHVPAGKVNFEIVVERLADYKIYRIGYYNNRNGDTTILPGTYKTVASVSLDNLTRDIVDLIRTGRHKLQVGCFLRYEDGFGVADEHVLNFRYLPPPNEGWEGLSLYSEAELRKMDEGNQRWENAEPEQPNASPSLLISPSPN